MNLKQLGVIIILIGCALVPFVLICLLLGAAFNGWNQSILKKLLNELDETL